MKITFPNAYCSLLLIGLSKICNAYEMPQHAAMVSKAFERSILTTQQAEIYARLGFDRLNAQHPFETPSPNDCLADVFPTKDSYAHPRPNWLDMPNPAPDSTNVRFRCSTDFDRRRMPLKFSGLLPGSEGALGATPQLRFEAWMMRGAIREDDFSSGLYEANDTPGLDPWNDQTRVFNHFYSPVTNSTDSDLADLSGGRPALFWALGEADPFLGAAQVPDPARNNFFTYLDARKSYFLALTYKRTEIANGTNAISGYNTRMALWATTLKSIGHVVHLLQDQASPQHSRGEPHNHVCAGFFGLGPAANQQIATRTYENYINYRGLFKDNETLVRAGRPPYEFTNACEEQNWLDMFTASGARPPKDPAIWFSTVYPTPQFRIQRMFFTTRNPGDPTNPFDTPLAQLNARAGLGDYANRGFFTQNYQGGRYASPPRTDDPSYAIGDQAPVTYPFDGGAMTVLARVLSWRVPDPINPNFPDEGLDTQGRAPIISASQWCEIDINSCNRNIGINLEDTVLTLDNYNQMADMLIPRAIAYTTGMINFFFRGKLTVDPIAQRVFAVMNQSDPHTMNADGYPIRTSNGQIFGFEKIRLRVRNSTDPITESGTNTVVPQTVGTGKLVAVARYHRNPCYKPDLTGERIVDFNNTLTEPNCPQGMRTNYQEISVSAPLTITGNADLPFGTAITASIEKVFDFSADPIPVNATDLFIQIVYRGQLGNESDGIAVGIVDTQEPTIVGAWNNTDHYYSNVGFNWLIQNGTNFAHRGIDSLSICSGGGLSSSVLLYRYQSPQDGFNISFLNGTLNPGIVRLALVNAKFPTPSNQQPYRMVPALNAAPFMRQRSTQSRGQLRQASQEIFTSSTPLPAPVLCQMAEPTGTPYWCFDPIKRRRGQPIGDAAQPMYFATGAGSDATDVDLPPALPVYSGLRPVVGGTVNFNSDAILMACPAEQQ